METAAYPNAGQLAHLEGGGHLGIAQTFPPLELITRPTVETAAAAFYLNRRPQTLRIWALTGHPIRPLRINGRLAWPVAELRRVLGVA